MKNCAIIDTPCISYVQSGLSPSISYIRRFKYWRDSVAESPFSGLPFAIESPPDWMFIELSFRAKCISIIPDTNSSPPVRSTKKKKKKRIYDYELTEIAAHNRLSLGDSYRFARRKASNKLPLSINSSPGISRRPARRSHYNRNAVSVSLW